MDNYKHVLLNELRNVKNEIRFYTNQGYDNNISYRDKYRTLYERKNELLRDFFEINKGYTLIDRMIQQELTNIHLRDKYRCLFYLQSFFCCVNIQVNILPDHYKKCTHIGSRDKEGKYLLEKVLEN